MGCRIAVDGDLLRWAMLLYRLGEEAFCGHNVSALALAGTQLFAPVCLLLDRDTSSDLGL